MIKKLDTFTLATDRSYEFECTATIYQDRNLDLPWKTNNAEAIGKAAWPNPDIDWSKTLVILGTEDTDYGFPLTYSPP